MIASYFFVSARVRAAEGISNAPGTLTTAISFFAAPVRSNPSHALSRRRSVMNALNRATTIAKRMPLALSFPSSPETSGSGGASTLNLIFFSVASCPRGEFQRLSTLCHPERDAICLAKVLCNLHAEKLHRSFGTKNARQDDK